MDFISRETEDYGGMGTLLNPMVQDFKNIKEESES